MSSPTLDEAAIFSAARQIEAPEARRRYIEGACAGDPAFQARLEALLLIDQADRSFLERPAAGVTGLAAGGISEGPGQRIGHYKLLQAIGEGGMGIVFMAEQEAPVRRKVALKIIKPGMDSRQVIARFEAERQALAMMDHQNIARVLDADMTETGQPYFVMELVHGVPITEFCDNNHLTPRERLELFVPVCRAIHHAHQKGIIHRDIKPSNILVTLYDDKPVPKVIDFGVAKAVEQKLTERTLFTQFGGMVGTFEYMSPEQAEMNAFGVDTRSDIYSLGVLLYELLTGTTPLEQARLRSASLYETVRLIKEEEPPRPSVRLSSSDHLPKIAAARKTEPERLRKLVRGELDWIVMKCLEKDRTRRYESASSLARDVEHYLADEPVEACPPSASYRLRKGARKYRTPLQVMGAFLLLLVAGVIASTWLAIRATVAEQEARSSERVAQNRKREADLARDQAEKRRDELAKLNEELRRTNYLWEIGLAQQAWRENQIDQVRERLEVLEPRRPGDPDLRGFEWYYLHRLCDASTRTLRGHTGAIYGLAFSPDGRHLVSAGHADGTIKIWDVGSGQLVRSSGQLEGVICVAYSPDGRRVASGGGSDNTVRLWEAASGALIRTLRGHSAPVPSVAFSPDGGCLASSSSDETIKVWDAETGREVRTLRGHSRGINRLAFSPDGKRLASASHDGTVRLWDAASGTLDRTLSAHASGAWGVAFSPDGRRVASCGSDATVRLWDAVSGQELLTLSGHRAAVHTVAYSPDGRHLASSSVDGTARVWDASSGQTLQTLSGHAGMVHFVTFSPDGRRLASCGTEGTVKLWDIVLGQEAQTLRGHAGVIASVAFSPDGRRLASAGVDRTVRLWDADSGQQARIFRGHTGRIFGLAFSPDGRRLASASLDQTVRLWDVDGRRELRILRGHTDLIYDVTFSPDGRLLASGGGDGIVRLWDPDTGLEVRDLRGHSGAILGLAFGPDSRRLASAGDDKTVRIWDATTGNEVRTLRGHTGIVAGLAFSPDGRRFASAGAIDGTVRLWDADTASEIFAMRGNTAGMSEVAFSPDGRRLAAAGGGTVKLWDVATGQPVVTLSGQASSGRGLAFGRDGRLAAAVGENVKIWDATPLTPELRTIRDAAALVEFLFGQALPTSEVLDRIRDNPSLDHDVRRRAQELAEAHGELLLDQEAERVVNGLYDRLLLRPEVRASLLADRTLGEPMRRRALALAEQTPESPARLNEVSWSVARQRGAPPEGYRLAVRRAEAACQLVPNNGAMLNTLGVAEYRAGLYSDAVATLTQSDRLNSGGTLGAQPADLAFLALAHHRLGQPDQARSALDRLRALMKKPAHASTSESQVFLSEAEAIELDLAFPSQPFAP
jgi:WD40 repeat protein/serine/threonine protein kinase